MNIATTSHECTCGHLPGEHSGKYGRCEGMCHDSDYGQFTCLCHAYEKGDQ